MIRRDFVKCLFTLPFGLNLKLPHENKNPNDITDKVKYIDLFTTFNDGNDTTHPQLQITWRCEKISKYIVRSINAIPKPDTVCLPQRKDGIVQMLKTNHGFILGTTTSIARTSSINNCVNIMYYDIICKEIK